MKQNKKGMTLNDLLPVVLVFVIVGIAITIGLSIQSTTRDNVGTDACALDESGYTTYNATAQACENSSGGQDTTSMFTSAWNASTDAIDANVTVASYLPTLGLVVAAAIIIGVLVTLLMKRN